MLPFGLLECVTSLLTSACAACCGAPVKKSCVTCLLLCLHGAHFSPVVWPSGLLQLRGIHRGFCTAAPVHSLLQGKEIN